MLHVKGSTTSQCGPEPINLRVPPDRTAGTHMCNVLDDKCELKVNGLTSELLQPPINEGALLLGESPPSPAALPLQPQQLLSLSL